MFLVNEKGDIEYGLGAVKGVADLFIEHVCEIRKTKVFHDLWDFSQQVDIKLGGKKSLEALSQSGAFDSIAPSRSIAISCIEDMLKDGSKNISKQACLEIFFEPSFNISSIHEIAILLEGAMLSNAPD